MSRRAAESGLGGRTSRSWARRSGSPSSRSSESSPSRRSAAPLRRLPRRGGRGPARRCSAGSSGAERVAPEDRKRILLYALLGISFNQVLFILGLSLTTAINATILTAMIPVYTLAAAALLKHERLTARAVLALAVAGAGATLLLRTERFDWGSNAFRGDLLLIANGISYAFYLVLSRPILARYRVLTVVSAIFAYGTLPILIAAAPALAAFDPSRVTPAGWASVAAIIVFCTVLPYFWNSWALARMHASRVAFYVFLQPLISTVLAVETLGERLTLRTAMASLLILSGLGVSLSPGRLPARPIP